MRLIPILLIFIVGTTGQASATPFSFYEALRTGNLDTLYRSTEADRREQILASACNPSDLFAFRLVAKDEEFAASNIKRQKTLADIHRAIADEPRRNELARSRLARLYELQSQLIDSKSAYRVFKNRPTDENYASIRQARTEKLRGLVNEMHSQATLLGSEHNFGAATMIASYYDDPEFAVRQDAWDLLEQRLATDHDQRRFALANCEASEVVANADFQAIRSASVLTSLPESLRIAITQKWLNR